MTPSRPNTTPGEKPGSVSDRHAPGVERDDAADQKAVRGRGHGDGLVDRTARIAVLVSFSARPSSAPPSPSRSSPGPDTGAPPRRTPRKSSALFWKRASISPPTRPRCRRTRNGAAAGRPRNLVMRDNRVLGGPDFLSGQGRIRHLDVGGGTPIGRTCGRSRNSRSPDRHWTACRVRRNRRPAFTRGIHHLGRARPEFPAPR